MNNKTDVVNKQGWLTQLWHKLGSPRWFYEIGGSWQRWFGGAAVLFLLIGTVWGLAFAPVDYQQGNSYRIMFVHVPTAIVAQSCFMMLGAAGLVLLVWRMKMADIALEAGVPVGMALTALALASGSIWGRPTWGAWWVSDARTISTLVMLFLYIALFALRGAVPRAEAAGRACAVLAIVGLVNIPIIKYSVEWWNTLHQTRSLSLTERPAMPASMYLPLLVNVLGFYCFLATVMIARMRNLVLRQHANTRWVQALDAAPTLSSSVSASAEHPNGV